MDTGITNTVTVQPARCVRGQVSCPGDKSISHRYAILAALAEGPTQIEKFSSGDDCAATLACLEKLGVTIIQSKQALHSLNDISSYSSIKILGQGLKNLNSPSGALDAQNSGTTLRLLAGVVASHPFKTIITGDSSLRSRPMRRIVEPLELMGAKILAVDEKPPLTITGTNLQGVDYPTPISSAQVKSSVLLAGLQANGWTSVYEPIPTRDHTERALEAFGGIVQRAAEHITIQGGQRLRGMSLRVPGDISSAAFWITAAAALPGSDVELLDIGLNPTRTALLDVLRSHGTKIDVTIDNQSGGEPSGRLRIRHSPLSPITISAPEVPGLIDELPVLAALAAHGCEVKVTGAAELRVKESDRITALVSGLQSLGANAKELSDGFHICGIKNLRGGTADAVSDHRLAMAFAIAALGATNPCIITGANAVNVSYPNFFETLESICER